MKSMQQLYGCICQFAIFTITTEIYRARDESVSDSDSIECDCAVKVNFKLPCYHELYRSANGELDLLVIDPLTINQRWHLKTIERTLSIYFSNANYTYLTLKLNSLRIDHVSRMPIITKNDLLDDGSEVAGTEERLYRLQNDIHASFKDCQTNSQRIDLLMMLGQALSGFAVVDVNDIYLPSEVKTKGRPKLVKGSRLPSLWEHQEAHQKKMSKEERKRQKETSSECKEKEKPARKR